MAETAERTPGQPTKLTPDLQERIVQAIRAGNYAQVAAAYVGISHQTFYNWLRWGEEQGEGKYFEFFEAVHAAQASAEVRAVTHIQKAMPDDWRAAATFLERRHPERWGRRNATEQQTKEGGRIVIREVVVHLPTGEAAEADEELVEGEVVMTLPAVRSEDE